MFSESEENYLKAIYKIMQSNPEASVSTKAISLELGTSAASVTDMIRKLADKGLLSYERYYGVNLTREGQKTALTLLRKHRLWEVFLSEKLKFNWAEVHEIAEQLEHIRSVELVDRLDAYLGYPKFDPHGDPIPNESGSFTYRHQVSLASATLPGKSYTLVGVRHHKPEFLRYLESHMLTPGAALEIAAYNPYDHSLEIKVNQSNAIWITNQTAQNLLVKPMSR